MSFHRYEKPLQNRPLNALKLYLAFLTASPRNIEVGKEDKPMYLIYRDQTLAKSLVSNAVTNTYIKKFAGLFTDNFSLGFRYTIYIYLYWGVRRKYILHY